VKAARAAAAFLVVAAMATPGGAAAPEEAAGGAEGRSAAMPPALDLAIEQRLGGTVPLDLRFVDETGRPVRLGDYLGDKPVLLTLAYYHCPMLCPLVLEGVARGLRAVPLSAGEDFEVITVSIDPADTAARAASSKDDLLRRQDLEGARRGWHFLTGGEDAIAALAGAVGFPFVRDERTGEYAHASGVMILTPDGRVAQYFLGIDHAPRDLRLALVEASGGRIGTFVDRLILLCYRYDPASGRYGAMTLRLVRIGGVLTVLAMAGFVAAMLRRDARRGAARSA
jgi:protein SCO1/2